MRHDLIVLSDEVYWAIRYGAGPHASVLDVDGMADRTILLDGWSKTFAMTGWRLGFGVFPPALVEPVTRLVINSVSCTSAFSQYAAIAALEGPWEPVEEMVAEFRRRRDVIVAGLNDIPGITCLEPQGAFYVFPNITGTGLTVGAARGAAAERRRAWRPCPAPRSAATARASCGSPTRTRSRTSRRRWRRSGRTWPRRQPRPAAPSRGYPGSPNHARSASGSPRARSAASGPGRPGDVPVRPDQHRGGGRRLGQGRPATTVTRSRQGEAARARASFG